MEESEVNISGFSLFAVLGAACIGMALADPDKVSDMMHRKAPKVRVGHLMRKAPEGHEWSVLCAYLDAHQRWDRSVEREKKRRKRIEDQLDVAHERIRAQEDALDSLAYLLPLHERIQKARGFADEMLWLAESTSLAALPKWARNLVSFIELRGVE